MKVLLTNKSAYYWKVPPLPLTINVLIDLISVKHE